jgi:hypothetical protein
MSFDIEAAKKAGKTDGEIASYLGKTLGFDVDSARKAGKTDTQIANYLSTNDRPLSEPSIPNIGRTQEILSSLAKQFGQGLQTMSKPIPYAAPMLGALAGGMAGLASPIPGGAAIGGAGGYYAGKQLERGLQGKIGTPRQQVGDLTEAAGQELLAGIPGLVKKPIANVFNRLFKKGVTPEMVSRMKLSEDTGVRLTPAEITGSKPAALIESHLDKNIATAGISQKVRQEQYDSINNLKQQLQHSIGGKKGTLEAGQLAQGSGNIKREAWMSKAQELYKNVPIEPSMPIETNNLRDVAIGHLDELGKMSGSGIKRILKIAENGMTKETTINSSILTQEGKAFKTTIPSEPTYNWKQLIADRAELNKVIRMTYDPNKKRVLHDVINAIDDDIAQFSNSAAPGVKEAFSKATNFYKEGAQIFRDRQIANTLKSSNPEDIVKNFIKPNNPSEIGRLSQAVGNDGMTPIKQAWFEKMVTKGEEQSFSPAKFSTAFEKYDIDTLKSFLTNKEISGLKKLDEIGRLTNKVEKSAGNPSGTGQTNITTGTLYALIRHPVVMVSSMMGSKKFAQNYFNNPSFRDVFIKGISANPKTSAATNLAARLTAISQMGDSSNDTIQSIANINTSR